MALDESNGGGMVMPVAPAYGGGNSGFGFGGDWGWIILLLLCANGGWGGFGGFGGGAMWPMMMGGMDGFGLYPWLNNSQNINGGFRDQMLNSSVSGIQSAVTSGFGDVQNALCSGFGNVQNSLCSGFAGVNASVTGAQNALAQQLYSNQIADLERSFAAQTANTQGMTALQSQFAQCCCDNRLATADTKYTIATEACANRTAAADNTNMLLSALNGGFQSIKDQLCADKIESKNDTIAQLRSELMYARGQASQDVQTAAIQAGQRALANEVEQYVLPTPRPAYIVQNPNCCASNYGYGCGAA